MSFRDPHEYVPGEFTQFTRFKRPPAGSGIVRLQDMNGVNLLGYEIELWTAASGGVQLVLNADYTLEYLDESITLSEGFPVYGGYQIINAAYQSVNLYITVKIVGGYTYRPYRPLIKHQVSTDTTLPAFGTEDAIVLSTPLSGTITVTLPAGGKVNEQVVVISSGPGLTRLAGNIKGDTELSNQSQAYVWDGTFWLPLGSMTGIGLETGEVTFYGSPTTPPDGKLSCDGTLYLIADYPDLFNVLGITWGGDGITTFAVPDIPATGDYAGGQWVIQAYSEVHVIPADPAFIKDYVLKWQSETPVNDVPFIWEGGVFFIGVEYLYNGTMQRSNGLIAIFDDGIDRYFAFSADFAGADSTIGVTYNGTAKTISCVAVGPDYTAYGIKAIYRFENMSTAELAQPKDGWELKFQDWTNTAAVPNMWGDGQYKATLRQGTGNAVTTSEVYIDRINTNLTVFSGTVAMPQYLSGVSFSSVSGDFTTVSDTGVAYIAEIWKFTGMVQTISRVFQEPPPEYGTVVFSDVTTSNVDTTAGRVTKVGDYGYGGVGITTTDWDTALSGGFVYLSGLGAANAPFDYCIGINMNRGANSFGQLAVDIQTGRLKTRGKTSSGSWTTWQVSPLSNEINLLLDTARAEILSQVDARIAAALAAL